MQVSGPTVALEGELATHLNRWLWLVKWLLAIPHYVVLVFLWAGFFVLTVIAFFAVLFTGRWPSGLRTFIIGVNRLGVRVQAYALLLVDDYPPFSLT